eukprot:GHVN01011847.1.p1 GENE.GHVN01011847.1~~GHVN01011847.1.p1  ORF type:complete len:226 (-),score=1.50 GHVN01011847.1:14-691(-)
MSSATRRSRRVAGDAPEITVNYSEVMVDAARLNSRVKSPPVKIGVPAGPPPPRRRVRPGPVPHPLNPDPYTKVPEGPPQRPSARALQLLQEAEERRRTFSKEKEGKRPRLERTQVMSLESEAMSPNPFSSTPSSPPSAKRPRIINNLSKNYWDKEGLITVLDQEEEEGRSPRATFTAPQLPLGGRRSAVIRTGTTRQDHPLPVLLWVPPLPGTATSQWERQGKFN